MRTRVFVLLILSLCLVLNGCGRPTAQSPAPGELEQYLQENPPEPTVTSEEPTFDPSDIPGSDVPK